MRKASLGTLFLTVFLDLLGFGLVIPFLPGVARSLGASDLVATLPGPAYSLMQFLFIPIWGRVSDRVGRRPVLLWSIAASAVGMAILGLASTLTLLFVARIWSGIATANIAVAQAYIADITPPERRARGMAIIGMGFGLGFIFGPAIGGLLGQVPILGRPGALPALVAAGLSAINLVLAFFVVPESLPPAARAARPARRAVPIDLAALRQAIAAPGVGLAVAINLLVVFWFAGMEQTLRLFTEDKFGFSDAQTGNLFAMVGVVATVVQGGLIAPLTRRFGEPSLVQAGLFGQALGFALLGLAPRLGPAAVPALLVGLALIAGGSGVANPSLASYVSRAASLGIQGVVLGALQSASALGRVAGPATGGLLYQFIGPTAPYLLGAAGMGVGAVLAYGLRRALGRPPE